MRRNPTRKPKQLHLLRQRNKTSPTLNRNETTPYKILDGPPALKLIRTSRANKFSFARYSVTNIQKRRCVQRIIYEKEILEE